MAGFTMTLLSLTGLLLIFIVLLQRGRGGGLAGAFGGAGGQSAFGTRAGDVFTKITVVLAVIWVVLAGATGFAMRAGATKEERQYPSAATAEAVETANPEKDEKTPLTDKDDAEKPSKPAATTDEPSKDEAKKDADAEKPSTDEVKKDEPKKDDADKPEATKPEPKDESAKPEPEKKEEPKTEKPEDK